MFCSQNVLLTSGTENRQVIFTKSLRVTVVFYLKRVRTFGVQYRHSLTVFTCPEVLYDVIPHGK